MAEVAGLVLGAIPLIISALEHYQDIVNPVIAFVRWRGQLSNLARGLRICHTFYRQNIRLLLDSRVSDQDLNSMIEDPQSHLWRENDTKLRAKLGDVYMLSMDTIKEIASIMAKIASFLSLDGSDQVVQHGLGPILVANPPAPQTGSSGQKTFYFRKRIDVVMRRREMIESLKELDDCNDRLYRLLKTESHIQKNTQQLETSSQHSIEFVAPLERIQSNANRLYHALHHSWCTAHGTSHQVGLLLEQRLERTSWNGRGITWPVGNEQGFGVSFLKHCVNTWLDTAFFLDADSVQGSSTQITQLDPFPNTSRHIHPPQEVIDICAVIDPTDHPYVGFRLDSSDTLRGLYEVKSQPCQLSSNCLTLQKFLPKIKRNGLPLSDRYCLAITLASSVLQLSKTPWLCRPWNKQTIMFLRLRDDDQSSIDIRHPYLTSLCHPGTAAPEGPKADHPNLVSLAIMLLEISTGTPLEKVRRREDLGADGTPNRWTDLSTANRLLKSEVARGQLNWAFIEAITCCLQSYFHPTASFDNPDFLKSVEERVLSPLEREMQVIVHGR